MDTTVKYIKMCGEAKKIQEEWKPKDGDAAWHPNEGAEYMGTWEFPETFAIVILSKDEDENWWRNMLWLPRQDQLQEMVAETSGFDGKRMIGLELCNLWAWYQQNRPGDIGVEMELWPSWEQLWLKFLMKKKYNKLWDGQSPLPNGRGLNREV